MIFFTGKIPDINFALNKFVQIICPYFTGKEHHLTFTCESGELKGSYLTHSTLPLTGATGDVLAARTVEVLDEYKSKDTIQAVLVDNTSANTGKGLRN